MKLFFLLILSFITAFPLDAQQQINKVCADAATHLPLAFVSIRMEESNIGTRTDVDGKFRMNEMSMNDKVVFSYVGYKTKNVRYNQLLTTDTIFLMLNAETMREVVIKSKGINPALRIMNQFYKHKKSNDPDNLPSFTYNAYTLASLGFTDFYWKYLSNTHKKDTTVKKGGKNDSLSSVLLQRLKDNYLFVSESYTKRIYKHPGNNKETVLATKSSGFSNPSFAFTSNNFQPFGFYNDYLKMLNKSYISPVISNGTNMYRFRLKEVIPHVHDTSFIIYFEPKPHTNFEGLKGLIYINSDKWAIENVIASPASDAGNFMTFKLQQQYAKIENNNWFPKQLNTIIQYKKAATDSLWMYWDTKSYIRNTTVNVPLSDKDFDDIETELNPDAGSINNEIWTRLREDSIDKKSVETYNTYNQMPDNVKKAFDVSDKTIRILSLGAIPCGKIDIPFKYLWNGINKYEKTRLGFGFITNEKFSKGIKLGMYGGYGFGDYAFKYGALVSVKLSKRLENDITFSIKQDIEEPGLNRYYNSGASYYSNQPLRYYYSSRMDSVKQYKLSLNLRPVRNVKTELWLLNEDRGVAGYYSYFDWKGTLKRSIKNTEAGLGICFQKGATYDKIDRAKVLSNPPGSEFVVEICKGIEDWMGGNLNYTKVGTALHHTLKGGRMGDITINFRAGEILGNVPYGYLFNMNASGREKNYFYLPYSFQTVGLYEFAADKYAELFVLYKLGSLLWKPTNRFIQPEITLINGMAISDISDENRKNPPSYNVANKPLNEAGILIDNLYRVDYKFYYLGIGAGCFYRYGAYKMTNEKDNWAFKIGLSLSF